MSMTISKLTGGAAALVLAALMTPALASAADYQAGSLKIVHPWTRPTTPGAPTAAGYMTIVNNGDQPDRLLGATSPDAANIDVHEESMSGGVMRMRTVEGGLTLPAHGQVKLAPGGYHLMIYGPKHAFTAGEHIPIALSFANAGAVRTALVVEGAGGGAMGGMDMSGMGGMH